MVVKCREKGSMDWRTIHTKEIKTIDDFKMFTFTAMPEATRITNQLASTCTALKTAA